MLVKNLTLFPFGHKATSLSGRQPQMTFAVRGCFLLQPDGIATEVEGEFEGDFRAHGTLSAEVMQPDDDDRTGEPLQPNDLVDYKANAEVMLRGTCHAPKGKAIESCLVTFGVGEWTKAVQVSGHRAWSDRKLGAVMSAPIPFRQMPVGYAYSYGGAGYDFNPVGKGAVGNELPNVEDPSQLVRAPSDRPALPAGFGPLNPEWPQRGSKRGKKYGAEYQKTRAPFYSSDFDWSYFHCAPSDQQMQGYLRGDEQVTCTNLDHEHPRLRSQLPMIRVRVFYRLQGGEIQELRMLLDTLFVDADERKLFLTWRGLAKVAEDDLHDVKTVLVASESLNKALPAEHYHQRLEAFEADPLGLEELGVKDFEKLREESLAQLNNTLWAKDEVGKKGDDELANDMARMLEAAGAEPEQIEKVKEGVLELVKARKEHLPDEPEISAAILEQKKSKAPYAPPPFVIPEPGKMPAVAVPELAAGLEDALAKSKEADEQIDGALEQVDAEHLPDELKERKRVADQLEPIEKFMASEMYEALRPPPFVEPGPGLDLSRQDYRGFDLRGRDLSGSDMREAQLSGADLSGANLRDTKLDHAVFYEATLAGADLSNATMKLANLTGAKAEGVVLRGVTLNLTFLDDANMDNADFSGCKGDQALIRRTQLNGANFVGAEMYSCIFEDATLKGADFGTGNLRSCLFQKCDLSGGQFVDAMLESSSFFTSKVIRGQFVGARGDRVVFLKAILDDADFSYSVLPYSFFNEASAERVRFFGANLKEARFYRTALSGATFESANLFRADMRKSILTDVSMVKANLFEASLLDAAGLRVDFADANLKRCRTTP